MISELIGAMIGRHIDEADGEDGAAGAVVGAGTVWIAKKVIPVAVGLGLLYAGFKIVESQFNKYNEGRTMIRNIIGMLVGREIDRRDGRGGAKGAIGGLIVTRALSRMGPLGLAIGGAYVAKKALDRRREERRRP